MNEESYYKKIQEILDKEYGLLLDVDDIQDVIEVIHKVDKLIMDGEKI